MSPYTLDQIPQTAKRAYPDSGCDPFRFIKDDLVEENSMGHCFSPVLHYVGCKVIGFYAGGTVNIITKLIDTKHAMKNISDVPTYVDKAMVALFITYSEERRNSMVVDFVRNATSENPITRAMFPHVTNALD